MNLGKRDKAITALKEEIKKNNLRLKEKMLGLKEITKKNKEYEKISLKYQKSYNLIIGEKKLSLEHIQKLIDYLDNQPLNDRINCEKQNLIRLSMNIDEDLKDLKI